MTEKGEMIESSTFWLWGQKPWEGFPWVMSERKSARSLHSSCLKWHPEDKWELQQGEREREREEEEEEEAEKQKQLKTYE